VGKPLIELYPLNGLFGNPDLSRIDPAVAQTAKLRTDHSDYESFMGKVWNAFLTFMASTFCPL
jgi:hypothetical protein